MKDLAKQAEIKNKHIWRFVIVFSVLVVVVFGIFVLNIVANSKYSLSQMFSIMGTKGWIDDPRYLDLQTTWWTSCATLVGAIGMAVSGMVTQSMTRNPLADSSTLGLTQAVVLGVVAAISLGWVAYQTQYVFAVIGGAIAIGLLIIFSSISKRKIVGYKLILAGLAIGLAFKTITFFFNRSDIYSANIGFQYVLGGAEAIFKHNFAKPWIVLLISSILTVSGLIVAILNAKYMTLLELGTERAKALGTKIWLTRLLSIIALLLTVPAGVIVVGNISFIGLFSAHAARYLCKTRDYRYTVIVSTFFAMFIASFGLQLTQRIPQVNSSLWMTFIGAPYLIYLGIRGTK